VYRHLNNRHHHDDNGPINHTGLPSRNDKHHQLWSGRRRLIVAWTTKTIAESFEATLTTIMPEPLYIQVPFIDSRSYTGSGLFTNS
jgi:hypothetical protein